MKTRQTRTPAFWDTRRHPIITLTIDSHQIPSQNKTKAKLQISKKCQNFKFWFCNKPYTRHKWCRLIKLCKYELDPVSIVEVKERTRFCPQTDGRTSWNQCRVHDIHPSTSLSGGYNKQSPWKDFIQGLRLHLPNFQLLFNTQSKQTAMKKVFRLFVFVCFEYFLVVTEPVSLTVFCR